ncbi:MAG: hypothetical protein Q4E46_01745 [Candidatus Saccharibacteria bacterium]|nr:hypothetical protein [Candidatus Saccharibacteria bacterium]
MDENNPNPTPEPIEPMAEPVAEPITMPSADTPKKGKGLKIGLIAGAAALLTGGVGFGAYAYVHTTPENVMLGTFSNLMNAKNIIAKGKVYVSMGKNSFLKSIEVSIDEKSSRTGDQSAGMTATFTAVVEINDEEKEFSVSTSEVVMKDGVLYFKVDGVAKIIDELIDIALESANAELQANCIGGNYTNCGSLKVTRKDLPQETKDLLDIAEDLVGEIDNNWWKVSIDELVDTYGKDYLSSKERTELKDAYACLVNQLHAETNKSKDYIELFKKYQFASITKTTESKVADTGTQYLLSLNGDKMGDFLVDSTKIIDKTTLTDCFKKSSVLQSMTKNFEATEISDENRTEFKKSLSENIEKMPKIYLAIDDWKHELIAVSTNYSNDKGDSKTTASVTMQFSYPTSIEATDTSKARSITELQKTVEKAIESVAPMFMPVYPNYDDYDF